MVQAALDRLAPDHRVVVVMKEFDGLRYEEIAEALGVPVGTVRSRLHRARADPSAPSASLTLARPVRRPPRSSPPESVPATRPSSSIILLCRHEADILPGLNPAGPS